MSNTVNISSIDALLVGNPQITYFKSIYRRHTQFMKYVDEIRPNTDGNEYISLSNANTTPIKYQINQSKYDLISDICIKHKMKFTSGNTIYANLGNTLINYISLDVGQTRDLYRIEGLAMEILSEAENPFIPSKKDDYLCPPYLDKPNSSLTVNTGNNYNITCFAGGVSGSSITENLETDVFFTRPNFDFCKHYDKSFPLCALVHSDVVFNVNYNSQNLITGDTNASLSRSIVIEGISLSSEEKRRVVNNTDIYIHNNVIPLPTFIGYQIYTPIKSIYITKKLQDPSNNSNASSSINTPVALTGSDFNNFKIDTGSLVYSGDPNTIIDILTKYNINKYYGYNGFGGRDLSDGSPTENKGFLGSIGLFTQGLENSDQPNGHISSSGKLDITGTLNSNNYKIYIETINFYQIISGHLGKMFVS